MFVLTTLVYPLVLALLCVGTGLLVDSASGDCLPACLLVPVGAAGLIAVSQLATYVPGIAPATPYLMVGVAALGFALAWRAARALARRWRRWGWPLAAAVLAYLLALAPVLASGRPTFSSYMALADSAVHLLGADFILRHGQNYSHLNLRSSYGLFVNDYYNTSYPSGADTLFGGSAFLLGLPLIWTLQPFNAFMLASAAFPAWSLARRIGLAGWWAGLAALSVTVPALVYAYELFASIKEITALPLIVTLGALAVGHRRWLGKGRARAVSFALVSAGGVSALGIGFGVWVAAALAVLLASAIDEPRSACRGRWRPWLRSACRGRWRPWLRSVCVRFRRALPVALVAALVVLVCALPTWVDLVGSLHVAQAIASTSNPGNLHAPLRATQLFGIWLHGSYKLSPAGVSLLATDVLIALAALAAVAGAVWVVYMREYALGGWLALMLVVWLASRGYATTWVDAKVLMLTSPVVVLLGWGGVAVLRASRWRGAAAVLALVLAGGVLASDALQYHSSNLAPTARYDELAALGARFAGRGPTLFTDFDEYALYELRDMSVSGPDFAYPPPALAGLAGGYGRPVQLERALPSALDAYRLIVTRRDPATSRPPAAYELAWQGAYYEVWARRGGARPALVHERLSGSLPAQCAQIRHVASLRSPPGARLVVAVPAELVPVSLAGASHPHGWAHQRGGLVMARPGGLAVDFAVPRGGTWQLWLQGQMMPTLRVSVDGRRVGSIAGQLAGNSLVPDTMTPLTVRLAAGRHRLSLALAPAGLSPGDGGSAVLDAIFLTPRRAGATSTLRAVAPRDWRALCGRRAEWVELVPARR